MKFGFKQIFSKKAMSDYLGSIVDLETNLWFNARNFVMRDVQTAMVHYSNYYNLTDFPSNEYHNSRALLAELLSLSVQRPVVMMAYRGERAYLVDTVVLLGSVQNPRYRVNCLIREPINKQVSFNVTGKDLVIIQSPFRHVDKIAAKDISGNVMNALENKLKSVGKIKMFIFSRINTDLESNRDVIKQKIEQMNQVAADSGGIAFLRQEDKVQQLNPDYSNVGASEFDTLINQCYRSYGVNATILDKTANDNAKISFIESTIGYILEQIPDIHYKFKYNLITSIFATGGLLFIDGYRERLNDLEVDKVDRKVEEAERLAEINRENEDSDNDGDDDEEVEVIEEERF